ncbi:MAG: Hpt domain-containing protein [Litoreibacter sp.]|nr:Hpt domain-containing protein [Litoreibacter sp.]
MVNWVRIGELRSDFGDDDFNEIISLFLSEVEERLSSLHRDDVAKLKEDLHFLKGSAANLGFDTFKATCSRLESDPSAVDLVDLRRVYESSKSEFLACCAQKGPGI